MVDHLKKIETATLKLLRKELGKFVDRVTVREDYDFADEEALFFVAHLNKDAPENLGNKFIEAYFLLRRELEKLKENRFPYLDTQRPLGDVRPTDRFIRTRPVNGNLSKRSSAR